MEQLGRIVSEFRARFNLSKAKAAPVLGVSINYVRSLEEGVDVRTGLPFEPRKSTLREIAANMAAYVESRGATGAPTYDELLEAAGLGETEAITAPVPLGEGKAVPGHPTADEQRILDAAQSEGLDLYAPFSDPAFWERSVEQREPAFHYLEGLVKETRKTRRQAGHG